MCYADARLLTAASISEGRTNVASRAGMPRRKVQAYLMGSRRYKTYEHSVLGSGRKANEVSEQPNTTTSPEHHANLCHDSSF